VLPELIPDLCLLDLSFQIGYQGGTQCAINRAIAFAPYADLLYVLVIIVIALPTLADDDIFVFCVLSWMETKSPIYAQAKEFAEGVHKARPGQWLAYNLSPSFNWSAVSSLSPRASSLIPVQLLRVADQSISAPERLDSVRAR
jgi:hypothetical protein